jgi:hypothetical protein
VTERDSVAKALRQAERKYGMAAARIVKESDERIDTEKRQQAAKGSLLSGGTWKLVSKDFADRLEALLRPD